MTTTLLVTYALAAIVTAAAIAVYCCIVIGQRLPKMKEEPRLDPQAGDTVQLTPGRIVEMPDDATAELQLWKDCAYTAAQEATEGWTRANALLAELETERQRHIETQVAVMAAVDRANLAEAELAAMAKDRDEARARAVQAWKDADAAIVQEVESRVASIMGSPDNEIARLTVSRNVFRDERDRLQIENGNLRDQLAQARSRGDDKEIAEKERDAARAGLVEALRQRNEAMAYAAQSMERNAAEKGVRP